MGTKPKYHVLISKEHEGSKGNSSSNLNTTELYIFLIPVTGVDFFHEHGSAFIWLHNLKSCKTPTDNKPNNKP